MIIVIGADSAGGDANNPGREWRRSSWSYGGGNCVEVTAPHGACIDIRDSKDPQGPVLRFTSVHWNAFLAGVRSGELGL